MLVLVELGCKVNSFNLSSLSMVPVKSLANSIWLVRLPTSTSPIIIRVFFIFFVIIARKIRSMLLVESREEWFFILSFKIFRCKMVLETIVLFSRMEPLLLASPCLLQSSIESFFYLFSFIVVVVRLECASFLVKTILLFFLLAGIMIYLSFLQVHLMIVFYSFPKMTYFSLPGL